MLFKRFKGEIMMLLWKCVNHLTFSTITKTTPSSWKRWYREESIVHLSGRVNRQNWRILGKTNPTDILVHERDSPKPVVWCSMSSTRLIGPCFFPDVSDSTTTVTGGNYLTRMQELAEPQLQTKSDLANVFFLLFNKTEPFPTLPG